MVTIDGREVVVRPQGEGWSFTLPAGHTIEFLRESVLLSTGYSGSGFELIGIDGSDAEERVVCTGSAEAWIAGGYPIPSIDEEQLRLRARCSELSGDWERISGWVEGDTWESRLRRIRGELRALALVAT